GVSTGMPVLYFHGSPGSRLDPAFIGDELWREAGMRVIALDRPGMGLSDFQSRRGFSHWPADVTALADTLGLQKFSVLGLSGGCGYVAACAAKIPERLVSAVMVSGVDRMDSPEAQAGLPPDNRRFWTLAARFPWLLRPMLWM